MVRRRFKGRDYLMDREVEGLLVKLSDLHGHVCRVHVELERDSAPRLRNISFLNSLHDYADGITGKKHILQSPPHSAGTGFEAPVESKKPGRLRLRHLAHRPPYPLYELVWPDGGSVTLIYVQGSRSFRPASAFAHQREAEAWATVLARAVRDELARRGL